MRTLKSVLGWAVLLVLLLLSLLFTYGPKYNETIPTWQDIYRYFGLVSETDAGEIYEEPFTVSFLDVGQGSAALLHSPDYTLLVDTGEQGNDGTIVEEMQKVGAKKLDYVILTHPHSDHVGSFPELVKTVKMDNVVTPSLDRSRLKEDLGVYDLTEGSIRVAGANKLLAEPGTFVKLPGKEGKSVTLQFFGPVDHPAAQSDNLNNSSVIVKVSYGNVSVLLTGDAEREEEGKVLEWMLTEAGQQSGFSLESTLYAAGHHGSYTSSSRRFMAAVKPKYAIVSCAKDNDYGHPHDSTLRTFKDMGAKVLRTDEQGTVVFGTDGKTLKN